MHLPGLPGLPTLSLRTRLAFVSLALLALPWFGWRYVNEMERFLLEGQQQNLLGTARAVATALHDRPGIVDEPGLAPTANEARRQAQVLLQQQLAEEPTDPTVPATSAGEAAAPVSGSPPALPSPSPSAARHGANGAKGADGTDIAAILRGLERTTSRIWVVNRRYRLLALAGSLRRPPAQSARASFSRQMLEWLIPPPQEDFDESAPGDLLATGKEIANALQGLPGTRLRASPDGRVAIVSAAYPVWSGDEVLGAVVVEETTNSILSVRNRALERLLLMTLAVFGTASAVMMWFSFRVSRRITRLRNQAAAAIDAQGHIQARLPDAAARDEIGDLSRSFSSVLARVSQQQDYLEALADRLSHELRTPVAVVRSSLENLRLACPGEDAQTYVARAEEGLARLSAILNRMSEATRLEQSLQATERETYDLCAVVSACVTGYRSAWPQVDFELDLPAGGLLVEGAPDLLAQMLDKLVDNAVDYHRPGSPVRFALRAVDDEALLSVTNAGPLLEPEVAGRLFNAMVSVRRGGQDGGMHLGLGLYVARLIARHHGGSIGAHNLADGSGVEIRVVLPRKTGEGA